MRAILVDGADKPEYTKGFWIGIVLALVPLAYGVRGLLADLSGEQLTSFLQFFIGGAVVHDLLVAPAVCAVGWFVTRWIPARARGPIQGALLSTAIVGLVSWPFVRGYGVTAGEPSFLSRNYASSVLIIWAVIWSAAALVVLGRVVSAARR